MNTITRTIRIGLALSAVALLAGTAQADDDKKDTLTVLPWTDASIAFTDKDQRATVAYTDFDDDGLRWGITLSAPLDGDSRIATFASNTSLVSGFKGSFHVGWDPRGEELASLRHRLDVAKAAVERLQTIDEWARAGGLLAFVERNGGGDVATNETVYDSVCHVLKSSEGPCAPGQRDVNAIFPYVCSKSFDPAKCGQPSDAAVDYIATSCATREAMRVHRDTCDIARWTLQVARQLDDAQLLQHVIEALEPALRAALGVDQVAELEKTYGTLAQAIASDPGAVRKAIDDRLRTSALARRDLVLADQSSRDHLEHTVAITGSLALDRMSVYQDGAAGTPVDTTAYDLNVGLDYTLLPKVRGLSFNVRVGYERQRRSGASVFKRCKSIDSTDPTVSGSACDDSALFRAGAQPAASDTGYVRLALDYLYRGKASPDELVPGVEGRIGLDGINGDKQLDLRLTLFGTPVKGEAAARVGVAIDAAYAIDDAPGAPRWTYTPLAFVGATFSDLMSH